MEVLKRPLVTEKASSQNENGVYGFVVDKNANKIEIKKAIEKMYGVSVQKVRTVNYLGKPKSRFTKSKVVSGRTSSYKKALVTVAKGEIIDFYSGI
jgi:large subunit ribosomal protein L23